MTLLIGIDEAGYGPNLGPLCIGASAWRVENREGRAEGSDLYERLAKIVCSVPDGERIAVADSKVLYKPASHSKHSGLAQLERGVLTALFSLRKEASSWRGLITPPELPWYADYYGELPIDVQAEEVAALADRFVVACETASVRLVDLRVRMVCPQEFNELTKHFGTKGAALSHVSLGLVKEVLTRHSRPATRNSITCDKHGGRNRYAALLQHHFADEPIEIIQESRPVSRYRWGPRDARTEICFRTKGEAELPVALASMAAKYHRELAMRAFNAYWGKHIAGLKPTAGYPQDAKRFKAEIAATQSKLGIDDHILWRNR